MMINLHTEYEPMQQEQWQGGKNDDAEHQSLTLQTATDTASIALAPRFDLSLVPSSSFIFASTPG